MNRSLALALFLIAPLAGAQVITKPCVAPLTCRVITDAVAVVSPPITQCDLFDGGVLLVTSPIIAGACDFPLRSFTAGVHSLTSKSVLADGTRSTAFSNTYTFTSVAPAVPPPAPTNPRIVP